VSTENPILLFLHGGPGFPEMPFVHIDSPELEKYFLVINWDQRGAGKSYNTNIPKETMNLKQFMTDTQELIQLLRKRFAKEKIFLLGHSWGSILGLYTVYHHPEWFHAYIGMGQVANMKEGEAASYEYTIKKAKEAGDTEALEILQKIGPPPDWTGYQQVSAQRQILAKYGGTFRKITYMDMGKWWYASPHYTDNDKKNLMPAFMQTQNLMWESLKGIDFFKDVPKILVPVYFFTGRYDYQTPFTILQKYFNELDAPYKEIVWFENSGHMPNFDEPEAYQEKLINIVLKNQNASREK
jgi:pimeloyl-ACP methyl ester carboxylesterase